jgi:DNA invertase Pin-like site-specific DNA recombinase
MTAAPPALRESSTEDFLAPEPLTVTGVLVGYARVSTTGQLLDRQLRALDEAGCAKVFSDQLSGRDSDRPELQACLAYLRAGDTLVVGSLDRLSRSLQDLIGLIAELRRRRVGFRSLHEAIDTTTPGGRLVFHVFAALAEFIRELIVQGTKEGLGAARARGVRLGRPPAMTTEQIRHARDLLTRPDNTVSSIARLLGVSRSTIYKYVPELDSDRAAGIDSAPTQLSLLEHPPVAAPAAGTALVPAPAPAPVMRGDPCACTTCGHRPLSLRDLHRHRQDLLESWLYLDRTGEVAQRHHCARCQPHDSVSMLACAVCGDGPLLAGELADQMRSGKPTPPRPVRRWLSEQGWHDDSRLGLVCAAHP